MGIEHIYADRIEEAFQRDLRNPGPAPEADSFSTWSFLKSGSKGPVSGALESAGTLADVLSGFATPFAASMGDEAARQKMLAGESFDTGAGNVLRRKADEFAPNPETSHKADQVVHGLARGVSKAVADVATMGPVAGAAVFGLDEGNTAAQRLRMEGVETGTAAKVGGVTGVISGLSAGIPGAGPTVAKTIGLAAATGPVSFMAQEALTRDILQRAGHNDLASMHDPLDPLGLALSTILPGVVGGLHIRGLKKAASLQDVVKHIESGGKRYGADGKLLTSPKGAQGEMQVMPGTSTDPGFGVVPAKDGSPEELARVGRDYLAAMQQRYGDSDKALAAYNAGPGALDSAIAKHGENWLAHMPDETQKYVAKANKLLGEHAADRGAADPAVVDAARVKVTDEALIRSLPDHPEARVEVLRASDELAAGRLPDAPPMAGLKFSDETVGSYSGQLDGTLTATRAGEPVGRIDYTVFDGRPQISMIEVNQAARRQGIGTELAQEMQRRFPDQEIDWGGMTPDGAALRERLATTTREIPEIKAKFAELQSAVKERDTRMAQLEPFHAAENPTPKQRAEAEKIAAPLNDLHDRIAALEAELHGVKPTKTLINLPENLPRSEGVPRPEPVRTGNALPGPDSPTIALQAAAAKAEPAISLDTQRVQQIATETPNLKVRLPGSDETVTVETALKQAREEFKHEASEADLVKAAMDCALSFGA